MKPSRVNSDRLSDEHLKKAAQSRELDYVSPYTKFECKGKRRFATASEIHDEIFRIMTEACQNYSTLKPYKCKYCHGYHLTSDI
jgi:hypothetical protein